MKTKNEDDGVVGVWAARLTDREEKSEVEEHQ